jgi:hypothetical protein
VNVRRAVRHRLAVLAGVFCLASLCLTARASAQNETMQRKESKTGRADRELQLNGFVRVDGKCAGMEPPRINLDRPPAHGIVCLRQGDVVLKYALKGTAARCLGHKAPGIRVFYRPHDGYVGKDEVGFTAHFPDGQINVDVDVTIVPDERPATKTAPHDAGAPAEPSRKCPGRCQTAHR